jgi:hypothetical protein
VQHIGSGFGPISAEPNSLSIFTRITIGEETVSFARADILGINIMTFEDLGITLPLIVMISPKLVGCRPDIAIALANPARCDLI